MDIQFILNNNNNNDNKNNNNLTTTTTTTTTQPLVHIQVFPPQNKIPRVSLKNINNNNNNSLNSSFNNVNMYIQSYNNSDQSSLVEDVSDETIINTIASLKNKSSPTSPTSTSPNYYSTQTTPIQSPLVSSSCHSPSKVPVSNINNNSNNIFNVQQQQINFINNNECNNFSDEESEFDMSDDCCSRRDEPSSPMMQVPNSPNCSGSESLHPIHHVGKTRNSNGTLSANGKKPRKSYEVYKKLEILEEKNQYGMNFVVKKYHISRSIISRWISNIDKYKSFGKKNLKKLHKGPKASFSSEQENLIIEKINQARANGEVVSGETIKKFALDLSKQLNNNTFKASSGWLENFKMRNNINLTGLTKPTNC